jgi:uncharacterized membrane protein
MAGGRRRAWRTERGFERLVFFSDAVVAIAISLLILPVVDIVTANEDLGVGDLFTDHWGELFAFALSFAVIALYWTEHHRMFETIDGYTKPIIWVNMCWLATIVFLPLPTEMLAGSPGDDRAVHALYIGTILVSSATLDVLTAVINRTPDVRNEAPAASADPVTTILLALALIVAVAVPAIGMLAMLLLFLGGPIQKRLDARRERAASG